MGYDINRFAKGSVSEEFLCPICQNVLQDPLLVESCEHIFCKDCIHRSLQLEDKCPVDKNNLTLKQLREPIRSFKNLLGQLEVSCEFASFGCSQWIKLDEIETHVQTCSYGPPDRDKVDCVCGLKVDKNELTGHQSNCITQLQMELAQLKSSLEELKQKEKEKKLQSNNGVKTLFEEWVDSGKQIRVLNCDMSAEKKSDALNLITEGLNNNDINFMRKMTSFFSTKYSDNWHALVFEKFSRYKYTKGNYLLVSIGRKSLRLFKTTTILTTDTIKEARTVTKPEIVKNTMKILMSDDAMAFAARAVFVGETLLQIASLIKERFTEKHGSNWNCLVSADNFGLSYTPKQQTSINMKFADLFIIIWQCP